MFGYNNGMQSMFGMNGFSGTSSMNAMYGMFGMSGTANPGGFSPMSSMSGMTTLFALPSGYNEAGNLVGGAMTAGSPTAWMTGGLFGYLGGTDSPAQAEFRMPIYRERYERQPIYSYEEHKAWDYDFQRGQSVHQSEDTASQQVRILENRDPVILDLNEDGELGVTGRDNSRRVVNESIAEAVTVQQVGGTEVTTTATHREWDTLINWDKKIDFDVDGDGATDRTEWLKKGGGDGFMVLDADGDGKINGRELMNETGLNGEQNLYKNGWEKARALFDKDGDGILQGDELKNVKIWADDNADGKTDAGELKSLDSLGIVKIDTNTGSFTKQKLTGYQTLRTKEEIGYVEHSTYAGPGNAYSVGSRLVMGGQVLQNFQMGS